MTSPLTDQQLDEIAGRAAHLHEYVAVDVEGAQPDFDKLTGEDVPAMLAEVRRLRKQRKFLIDQIAKKDAASGAGDKALRRFLAAPDPICGDENDGDWCELEPGHEGRHRADTVEWAASGDMAERLTTTRPCGHDDYHDPHEWADRPGVWCPGHSTEADTASA